MTDLHLEFFYAADGTNRVSRFKTLVDGNGIAHHAIDPNTADQLQRLEDKLDRLLALLDDRSC